MNIFSKFSWIFTTFILGLLIGNFYSVSALEKPFEFMGLRSDSEIQMPKDRIKESQIKVFSDRIIIEIKDPQWAKFANTNSMVPFLDEGANAIQIIPKSEIDLQVGDIISYKSSYVTGIVIHRIIEIGHDEKGIYFIAKGDNNLSNDPEKIRFEQIERVLVGIIY
jgi:hypothetical protein